MDDAKALFYTNKQGHDESNADYLNKFKNGLQVPANLPQFRSEDQYKSPKENP
jgi:hypothetical protein